jgi:hypothetical protein
VIMMIKWAIIRKAYDWDTRLDWKKYCCGIAQLRRSYPFPRRLTLFRLHSAIFAASATLFARSLILALFLMLLSSFTCITSLLYHKKARRV